MMLLQLSRKVITLSLDVVHNSQQVLESLDLVISLSNPKFLCINYLILISYLFFCFLQFLLQNIFFSYQLLPLLVLSLHISLMILKHTLKLSLQRLPLLIGFEDVFLVLLVLPPDLVDICQLFLHLVGFNVFLGEEVKETLDFGLELSYFIVFGDYCFLEIGIFGEDYLLVLLIVFCLP